MALVLLPTFFVLGFVGGTCLPLWGSNKGSAVLAIVVPLAISGWLWLTYYRTRGIMHQSGFHSDEGGGRTWSGLH